MTATSGRRRRKAEPTIRRLSAVIRVSRRNGRKGDTFLSPTQQRDLIVAWAKRVGALIVSWHDETDSVSGRTTNRAGLQAAMAEVLDGRSDGLIVAKVDRFSRSLPEGLAAVRRLHENDKAFIAVSDGVYSWDPTDFSAKVLLTILLLFAEWQLDTLTAGWEDVRARCVADGVATRVPYGYRRDDTTRRLVPDPSTARWVRRIFEWRAEGASWTAIADRLTAKGAPTPADVMAGTTGSVWSHNMATQVTQHRVYLGELRSGEYLNPTAHKAIVSADLWQAAHGVRMTSPKANRLSYPLAGIVRCASCGARMGGTSLTNGDRRIRQYRCRRRFSWGHCPAPATIRADDLEAHVYERLLCEATSESFGAWLQEGDGDIAQAVEGLREAEAELSAYMTSTAAGRVAALDPAAFAAGVEQRAVVVERARDVLAEAERSAVGAYVPADLGAVWDDLDDEERRLILSAVFPVIAVARSAGRGDRWTPIADRVRIWQAGERDLPQDLPARGRPSTIRPIPIS